MIHNTSGQSVPDFPERLWRFGGCEFDELRLELRIQGVLVELERKPLEVLIYLLQHADRVVTREELFSAVWPGVEVVDGSLATAVSKLRKALGDTESSIVLTVPRVGYRLVTPVRSESITVSTPSAERGFPAGTAKLEPPGLEREPAREIQAAEHVVSSQLSWLRARKPGVLIASATLLLVLICGAALYRKVSSSNPRSRTLAILPFQNLGSDHTADFLRLALPDEIATQLSYTHSLAIRPVEVSRKYDGSNPDLQKAGREMGVNTVVTGQFLPIGEQLQISLDAVDVDRNVVLWRDTINVPAKDMIAMEEQIAAVSRGGLAPALGSPALSPNVAARPQSEEAYSLYLRSTALSSDEAANGEAIAMLQKAVDLDANYAPTWSALSGRYYNDSRYAGGGQRALERADATAQRALALDPNNIAASANLVGNRVERGQLVAAYREARDMVQRRPDNALSHFILSYVLRYAGLLQEAAVQCETALSLDPQNPAWRSCSGVFLLLGNYQRSLDYVSLDRGSVWSRAHVIDALLREGKVKDALVIGETKIPRWQSYNMLLACADHKSPAEVAAIAKTVQPFDDPEVNYYFAAHLAYCSQTDAALSLLMQAIQGGYCSYPSIDTDPFFKSVRTKPEFADIRSAAIACQEKFLAERDQPER
jgi:DNA-binding winged helix-turn-helix (wHTH) protein/TolB-like protein